MAEVIQINSNTWRIEDGGVRFFVLTGGEKALVIDTGMSTRDAHALAESVTLLPLMLVNTHTDRDHVAGNEAFSEVLMHPAEWAVYRKESGYTGQCIPLKEGDSIDLGGRILTVFDLPGHTPGSIALLDSDARTLFGGDSIQDGHIFMFGRKRSFPLYVESMKALWANHRYEFDEVYPSHSTLPVSPGIIPNLIMAAESIMDGTAEGKEADMHGTRIRICDFGFASFLCDPEK